VRQNHVVATAAQRALQPADLILKRSRRYQRVRRAVLAASVAVVVGAPLWHLRRNVAEGAGLAARSLWATAGPVWAERWAPLVEGAPWTVRVAGVEFLDPLAALSLLATRAFSWQALVGCLPALLLTIALGRFFCGWLCPYLPFLAASNAARALLARLGFRPPDVRLSPKLGRAVLAGLIVASAVAGSVLVPLAYPPALIGREAWRAVFQGSVGAGAVGLAAAFAFDTFVSRAGFCRSLCPGGALFALLGAKSRLAVSRTPAACTDCHACDVVCNLGQSPMTDQVNAGCERCGKCVAVCPTAALAWSVRRVS